MTGDDSPTHTLPPDLASEIADLPPTSDGEFEIQRELGRGGFATTYLATYQTLSGERKACVVKALHPKHAHDINQIRRFLREGKALVKLRGSPHIVAVRELKAHSDGAMWLVMEYISGESLAQRLKRVRKGLTVEETLRFAYQVANALVDTHAAGLIHRDVKPSNIMIAIGPDGAEIIKVIDFGIVFDEMGTKTSFVSGTHGYMPPEQQFGEAVSTSADLYGLGVTIFEMLTKTLPFERVGPTRWRSSLPPNLREFRSDIEFVPLIEDILKEILQPDHNLREGSAKRIAERLSQAIGMLDEFIARKLHDIDDALDNDQFEAARSLLTVMSTIALPDRMSRPIEQLAARELIARRRQLVALAEDALGMERFKEAVSALRQMRDQFEFATDEISMAVARGLSRILDGIVTRWSSDGITLPRGVRNHLREFQLDLPNLYEWRMLSICFRCFQCNRLERISRLVASRAEEGTLPLRAVYLLASAAKLGRSDQGHLLELLRLFQMYAERDTDISILFDPIITDITARIDQIVTGVSTGILHSPEEAPALVEEALRIAGPDHRFVECLNVCYSGAVGEDVDTFLQSTERNKIAIRISWLRNRLYQRRIYFSTLSGYVPPPVPAEQGIYALCLALEMGGLSGLAAIEYLRFTELAELARECESHIRSLQPRLVRRADNARAGPQISTITLERPFWRPRSSRALFWALRCHWRTIFVSCLIGLLVGCDVSLYLPPVFESSALIQLSRPPESLRDIFGSEREVERALDSETQRVLMFAEGSDLEYPGFAFGPGVPRFGLHAVRVANTDLIKISFNHWNPVVSYESANKFANEAASDSVRHCQQEGIECGALSIQIIALASGASERVSPGLGMGLLKGGGLGASVALVYLVPLRKV